MCSQGVRDSLSHYSAESFDHDTQDKDTLAALAFFDSLDDSAISDEDLFGDREANLLRQESYQPGFPFHLGTKGTDPQNSSTAATAPCTAECMF